jgi:5-methylcytosine-specific restriction endonuclease McrA
VAAVKARNRLAVLSRDGEHTECAWCGERANLRFGLSKVHDWHRATLDHVLPRALGGGNDIDNTTLACAWCNVGRSMTGHCITALRCAEAVLGRGEMAAVAQWFQASRLSKP